LNQGPTGAVAIGASAGQFTQGASAVAIGYQAGQTGQSASAVAIGASAGQTVQGANAIAIGNMAGATGQFGGSIVLNASGVALNPGQTGFFVDPIRVAPTNLKFGDQYPTPVGAPSGTANTLYWDSSAKELLYAPGANVVRIEDAAYSLDDPQFPEQVITIIKTKVNPLSIVSTTTQLTTKIKNQTGVHTSVTMEGPYSAMTLIGKQKAPPAPPAPQVPHWTWDIVSSIGTITTDLPIPEVIIANHSDVSSSASGGVGLLIGIPPVYNARAVTSVVITNSYNSYSYTLSSPTTGGGGWPAAYYVFYEDAISGWWPGLSGFNNLVTTSPYPLYNPQLCNGVVFGNRSLIFTVTESSDPGDPHVLTCILPGLDVGDGRQYQQYNKIAAQTSQFLWGPTAEDWGTQTGVPQQEPFGTWKSDYGTGTVGTISSGPAPWTASVTGLLNTFGITVNQPISATNGPLGIGSLSGGSPALVTAVYSTSFDYSVAVGTGPVAGPVTNILPLYSQKSIYKYLYPSSS
jgi:hypothetical protein